jgi:SAM-dependent methyltransferase
MRVDNRSYWDAQAADYDSLYTSSWWRREDDRISGWLPRLTLPDNPTVLDIGCGTGSFLRQLAAANIKSRYFGVDISPDMVANFHSDEAAAVSIEVTVADAADYQWPHESGPNLIASIYSPLSFSEERWTVIRRLAARQLPGDKLFITLLNRYALRRLMSGQFSASGDFSSRGSRQRSTVEVFFERARHVQSTVVNSGYRVIFLGGDGPLSGVLEVSPLWHLNAWLGKATPALSHSIILIAEKVP